MDYYIGIDIGTTSTKAVAFSPEGDILAKESIGYAIQHPQPGYSEQDPHEIFDAVINAIAAIAQTCSHDIPVLVSFSSAMHNIMAVDEKGIPLSACIIWADNRAGDIADHLRQTSRGHEFYHATGVPIHAMSPFCKLLWLRQNNPELFSRAHKFIGIKEYIFHRLFGKYLVDTAIASATGLLDIHTLQWHKAILGNIGIGPEQLAEVVEETHCEFLQPHHPCYADKHLQPLLQTAFVIGGSDGALANLGSGATGRHSMAITIGTSSAVRMVADKVYTDVDMRTFCYHFAGGQYIIGGASNNGAVVLQWLKETLLQTDETHEQLFEQARHIPAGAEGLLFIPYLLGERAPVWNSHARGILFGLDITHTRAHLVRAAMEGVVYSVYSIGRVLMEKRSLTAIHASGGFTQSPLWLQMLSDMFNCMVLVSGAVESSAAGAVQLGREALGITQPWAPKTEAIYQPDIKQHQTYLRRFSQFENIYKGLENEMHPAAGKES